MNTIRNIVLTLVLFTSFTAGACLADERPDNFWSSNTLTPAQEIDRFIEWYRDKNESNARWGKPTWDAWTAFKLYNFQYHNDWYETWNRYF